MKIKKILDLSQTFYHNNPGYMPYQLTEINYETLKPRDGYTSERMAMNTHTSTHIDAPAHHFPEGKSVAQIEIEQLVGEGVVVDLFDIGPHQVIGPEHLAPYEDKIGEGDIVLLCTGWGFKRGWTTEYVDNWPYLGVEGARWLLEKKVKGIAIDTMSVGGPRAGEGLEQHELLLGAEVWLGEELFFPKELLEHQRWEFMFLPLKLEGCGGAPGRAIAMIVE
ncbi:arylformamidase [Lachnospiraceae bacterium PF1-22]|uniref:cyclase family protein n=1 Tax=Ohessyouella blattaphilus TaxID=2949333 RepID=UPI003E31B45C